MKKILFLIGLLMGAGTARASSDVVQPVLVVNCPDGGSTNYGGVAQPVTMTNICPSSTTITNNLLVTSNTWTAQQIFSSATVTTLTVSTLTDVGLTNTVVYANAAGVFVSTTLPVAATLAGTQTFTGGDTFSSPSGVAVTFGITAGSLTATNITSSSNTILPGATFYQNGTAVIGSSVTVGRLAVLNILSSILATNSAGVVVSTVAPATIGNITGASAPAGSVGEVLSSVTANSISFTAGSNAYQNSVSITLTSGTWLMSGAIVNILNGATCTAMEGGIATASGNNCTGCALPMTDLYTLAPTAAADTSVTFPTSLVGVSVPTTEYMKVSYTIAAGNPQFRAYITAIRIY